VPLDIQTGGFAEKMRRALGVRGRMPFRLDETVIPTVEVNRLDLPPYRTDASDFATNIDITQVAAEFAFGGVKLPASSAGAVVIDQLMVTSEAADSYSVFLGNSPDYEATASLVGTQNVWNVESMPRGAAGVGAFTLPFNQNLRGTDPVLGIGSLLFSFRMVANENLWIPLRATLRPGWAIALWRRTVNTPINCSWFGTYYPNVISEQS
jgi:hypothetical protein